MTMTEIVGTEAEIDHIIEIDHKTTTKMTIGKKIIGGTKIRNRKRYRDYYRGTYEDRYEDNYQDKYKDGYR